MGVHICHDNSAYPTLRDGELCLTYRLADIKQGAMIVYKHDGKVKFGRVIAFGGDKVEIFNDYINKDFKEDFEKIQELFFELLEEEAKESFCNGYCLGVNLTIEALRKDETK